MSYKPSGELCATCHHDRLEHLSGCRRCEFRSGPDVQRCPCQKFEAKVSE